MNEYAKELLSSSSSWSSAYLQFATGRGREGYTSYAFVEDSDDKGFYQLALTEHGSICYLGCGGKSGVEAVFEKIDSDGAADCNLFFVDRDTESEPFSNSSEILRTEFYSWESYVCQPDYVGWFLQRKLEPNLTDAEVQSIKSAWIDTIDNFKELLAVHTALCRTALVKETSLGMSKVVLTQGARFDKLTVHPAAEADKWCPEKFKLAEDMGVSADDISRRTAIFLSLDPINFSKGKLIFQILRAFVTNSMKYLKREFRGTLNSALSWLEAMPWTNSQLQFIRNYAESRFAACR